MRILICGDIVPTEINESKFIDGDVYGLFGGVAELIKNSNRSLFNLECALTVSSEKLKKMGPNLKASPECAKTLRKAGFTDCMLSNNHVFDYGKKGLLDTIKALDENNILWTGIGKDEVSARKNHIIEENGKKIAIINVCEHEYSYALSNRIGARAFDPFDTLHDIREAKKTADFVIVIYHGGKEQCEYPSPRLRKLCRAMIDCGADLVTCQHSHCIGCYEEYNNGYAIYGQGNFHFCKHHQHPHWKNGLILELTLDESMALKFIPVVVNNGGIELAQKDEQEEILNGFYTRSEKLKNGDWYKGWQNFCNENSGIYYDVIKNAYSDKASEIDNEFFAHYLDCEAHCDVWRELAKTWNHTN